MKALRVKLDENLGQVHLQLVLQAGYQAESVRQEGLAGAPDDRLWQQVCTEQWFFSTLDLDFADLRRFPPGTHPGILILRPRTRSERVLLGVLARVLHDYPLETLQGCHCVADERNVRVRRV